MKRTTLTLTVVATIAVSMLLASPVQAQMDWGIRAGIYSDDSDPFIGVELLMPLIERVRFNPNIEFMFGDNRDLLSVNADFVWDFVTRGDIDLWAGAGPALMLIDDDRPGADDDTEFGLNLVAGVGLRTTMGFLPYLQGKIIVADDSEGVFAIGARF